MVPASLETLGLDSQSLASAMSHLFSQCLLCSPPYPSSTTQAQAALPSWSRGPMAFWHVCTWTSLKLGMAFGGCNVGLTRASLFVTVSTLGKIVHHFCDSKNLSSY
jgi:hypothetical protein